MDKKEIINLSKAERHLHGGLGCSFKFFQKLCNNNIPSPPSKFKNLEEMEYYIEKYLLPYFHSTDIFEEVIKQGIKEAINDGIIILEMSIDCNIIDIYSNKEEGLINFLKNVIEENKNKIDFRPELGINKTNNVKKIYNSIINCINTGIFKSIDLYGIEDVNTIKNFRPLYKYAKNKGLKLKAHAGEFCEAKTVIYTVDTLDLDEVQHGITVADSEDAIKYIKDKGLRLNICPTSNIALQRVKNIKVHPIRKLFDKGIKVTINTDDIMIFGQTLSDEYFNVYKAGLFSEEEIKLLINLSLKD
ncbi:MAG TPA: hypothetical protein P5250_00500 [Bacteroidales bacterium]|nr:hypothetical protein [Bacteroidales bacterium]